MPHSLYTLVALGCAILVVLAALGLGDREERQGAAWVAGGWIAVFAAQRYGGRPDPVALLALVDGVVLVAFLRLSWRSRRVWPMFACGCQGVSLAVHAIRVAQPKMSLWAYLTALAVPSYALLLVLAAGTGAALWRRWRRRRHMGLSS